MVLQRPGLGHGYIENELKKVGIVTYGGGHVAMMLPVIRLIQARPDFEVHVLGLTAAQAILEREQVPYLGFRHLWAQEPFDDLARAWGEKLTAGWASSEVLIEESVAYMGMSYADLVLRLGEPGASEAYDQEGRAAFLPKKAVARWMARVQPDIVVATNSPRGEMAALLLAKEHGIPSLCVNDMFAVGEIAWLAQPGYGTRICIFHEFVRKVLEDHGRPAHEIVVTGNPAFAGLDDENAKALGQKIRMELGWSGPVLLYAAQSGEPGNEAALDDVLRELGGIAQRNPDWLILVRPHPNKAFSIPETPNFRMSAATAPLAGAIQAADAVIVMSSTVGLQAMMAGVPLVQIETSSYLSATPYAAMGYAVGVPSTEGLESGIRQALDSPKRESPFRASEGAAERILDQILELSRCRSSV